ncbi:Rhodanese-like domain-containing protein [Aspergillus tetrazonus]
MAFAAVRSSFLSPTRFIRPTMPVSQQIRTQAQTRQVSFSSYLVTPKELSDALKKNPSTKISTSPRVIPLCAAWFMPNDPEGRSGIDVFRKHRVPQARFFDLDAIKDTESPYPHMLPTAETFAQAMSELGIRRDDEVVVYDTEELGIFSAPRVGWTLRVFGHPRVHILNNYRLWVREGYPTETGEPRQPEKTNYPVPSYDSKLVIPFRELKEIAKEHRKEGAKEVEILDARSQGRWAGTDPEPRPGLSSGHIPGSTSLPFQELLDPETKTYLPPDQLRKIFESRDIDETKSIISSCGTGVTATIIETALGLAEYGDPGIRRVYDGSWTEWAQRVTNTMSAARKVFHCAVDETALTTNISEIKKWATNGAITLIVPLYTLERLHALKKAGSQVAINAREAVRFLDRATSDKGNAASERVILQGPMEQFEDWSEAEKFFLPEFEEEPEAAGRLGSADEPTLRDRREEKDSDRKKSNGATDDLSRMLLSKLNFKKDPDAASATSTGTHSGPASRPSSRSSRTSPDCVNNNATNGDESKDYKSNGHRRTASGSTIPVVPPVLRPLLSALLWKLHESPDASNAAKAPILVTNDRNTQIWAQKFGIAVKNIHQLRTSIQYEEREYKNRCKYVEKTQNNEPKPLLSYEDESDEDELVFVPRGRGKGASKGGGSRGSNNRKTSTTAKPVAPSLESTIEIPTQPIDPNSFSRSLGVPSKQHATVDLSTQAGASRGFAGASRNNGNNRRGTSRGQTRGGSRGRGKLWVP